MSSGFCTFHGIALNFTVQYWPVKPGNLLSELRFYFILGHILLDQIILHVWRANSVSLPIIEIGCIGLPQSMKNAFKKRSWHHTANFVHCAYTVWVSCVSKTLQKTIKYILSAVTCEHVSVHLDNKINFLANAKPRIHQILWVFSLLRERGPV